MIVFRVVFWQLMVTRLSSRVGQLMTCASTCAASTLENGEELFVGGEAPGGGRMWY